MNRYKVTKQLGDGTYGSVLKAINRTTSEVVSTSMKPPCGQSADFRRSVSILHSGRCEEDEEKILHLGGMHAAARSEGACTHSIRTPSALT
jgi:hypothetical protein